MLTVLIVLIWYLSGYYIYTHFDKGQTGTIGDLFSPINSLFSGLAFCGIIITIFLQQKELSLQRQELVTTREIFQKQQFENTFFQLSSLHQSLVNNIHHEFTIISNTNGVEKERNKVEFNGRDYFHFIETDLKELFHFVNRSIKNGRIPDQDKDNTNINRMLHEYSIDKNFFYAYPGYQYKDIDLKDENQVAKFLLRQVCNAISYKVSHYYRHIFSILDFIQMSQEQEIVSKADNRKLETEIRFQQYAAFFQAQFSNSELFLLFYFSLDRPELKALVNRYNFFKSLSSEFLISSLHADWHNN